MKKIIPLFILALGLLRADEESPRWTAQLAGTLAVGATIELVVRAELPAHAVVYSTDFQSDLGPQPTVLDLAASEGIELVGPVRSIAAKRKHDKTWDVQLGYFEGQAEVRQTVKVLRSNFSVRGTIAGQLCDEKAGTCTLFRREIAVGSPAK